MDSKMDNFIRKRELGMLGVGIQSPEWRREGCDEMK